MVVGKYPEIRLRRNRRHEWLRRLVRESSFCVDDLIWPVFVIEGAGISEDIAAMAGVKRYSVDLLVKEVERAYKLGIPAIALFPVVNSDKKSENAEEAYNSDNLMCRAIKAIKGAVPDIGVICDVALDPYTSHGQDGLVIGGYVANDETINILCKQANIFAASGCDIVAPSDMMDGRIGAIRKNLDSQGFESTGIISYAAKYASSFYGPFRDAVGSASNLGTANKNTYQMDIHNSDEAMREVELDIAEGADIVIVKPGMPYLDIVKKIKDNYNIPILAYQVSGEYAMIISATNHGWLEKGDILLESMVSFKRAGASGIITYGAIEIAEMLAV